jgi:hypothetical protein
LKKQHVADIRYFYNPLLPWTESVEPLPPVKIKASLQRLYLLNLQANMI